MVQLSIRMSDVKWQMQESRHENKRHALNHTWQKQQQHHFETRPQSISRIRLGQPKQQCHVVFQRALAFHIQWHHKAPRHRQPCTFSGNQNLPVSPGAYSDSQGEIWSSLLQEVGLAHHSEHPRPWKILPEWPPPTAMPSLMGLMTLCKWSQFDHACDNSWTGSPKLYHCWRCADTTCTESAAQT